MKFFQKAIEEMAADSLRCVAFAYRSHKTKIVTTNEELLAHRSLPVEDLVLLAIIGIQVCIFSGNMPIIGIFLILVFLTVVVLFPSFEVEAP